MNLRKNNGFYQSVTIDGGNPRDSKALSHIDRKMHEAQMSITAYLGKQLGVTKTGRSKRVKCPLGNHYHCCSRHVCD